VEQQAVPIASQKRGHMSSHRKMKVSLLIVVFIPLASILDVKNNSEI
jgi:hypothetical protein